MSKLAPHAERQWPYTEHSHAIASLQAAASGADALTRLLLADSNISDNLRDSDDPEAEAQPQGSNMWHGLLLALGVCIDAAGEIAEHLGKAEISERERLDIPIKWAKHAKV